MLVTFTDLNICTESCSHRIWLGSKKGEQFNTVLQRKWINSLMLKHLWVSWHLKKIRVPLPPLLVTESHLRKVFLKNSRIFMFFPTCTVSVWPHAHSVNEFSHLLLCTPSHLHQPYLEEITSHRNTSCRILIAFHTHSYGVKFILV